MNKNSEQLNGKKKFDSRYFKVGAMAFGVIAVSMLLYFFISKLDVVVGGIATFFAILQPIVIGFVIAYLTNPIMKLLDKLFVSLFVGKMKLKKFGNKLARGVAILLSMLFFLLIISVLLWMVLPSLVNSIISLTSTLPVQIDKLIKWVTKFFEETEDISGIITSLLNYEKKWIENNLMDIATSWAGSAFSGVVKTAGFLSDLVIGVIVAVYLLISKETFKAQFKKVLYAFAPNKFANGTLTVLRKTNEIFGGFISGTLISSLVVGVLCFIGSTLMGLPYAALISVFVGVTNVIPVFGPYIGGVVGAMLILLFNPMKALYFILFIIILQALEGNILAPKILGDYTGLSPFWVVFSIVLCGGVFGLVGMVIGVPLFAVLYYLINEAVRYKLRCKKLPLDTDAYLGKPEKETEEVSAQ